jgi:cytochrome c5
MGAARIIIAFLFMIALADCSRAPSSDQPSAEAIARAAAFKPAQPNLAELYASACRTCHGAVGTGAPLAGDRAAWDRRWNQGMDTLLDHVVSGYRGMPAGGQCFACTRRDYQALITLMAGRDIPGE